MEAWRWREFLLLLTAFVFSVGFASGGFLLLLVLVAVEVVGGEPLWPRTPLDPALAALVAAAFLSAAWSPWRGVALTSAVFFAVSATVVIRAVVLAVRHRPEFGNRLLTAWVVGAVPASLVGIAGTNLATGARAQLPLLGPNALGTTLAVAAILLLGLSSEEPRLRRLLCLAAFPLVVGGLMLTWTRGAWLGAAAGLAVLLATTPLRRFWPNLLAATAAAAAASALLAPGWMSHRTRILDPVEAERQLGRIKVWRVVPRVVADHLVLGTGLGTFPFAYARYTQTDLAAEKMPFAHSIVLNFAAETGLVGLAALLWFLGAGAAAMVRWQARSPPESDARTTGAAVLAAFTALLGHQLVDGTVMGIHVAVGLYMLMGLGAAGDPGQRRRR